MSGANVEIVRRYFEQLDELLANYSADPVPISQYPLVEEAFKAIAPEAEWKPPFMGEAVRGRDAWLALVSGWLEAADDWRVKDRRCHRPRWGARAPRLSELDSRQGQRPCSRPAHF